MKDYTTIYNAAKPPVTEPIIGKNMITNRGGGYGFKIDPIQQFKRFLILGSESNTYYASAKELTVDNTKNIVSIIQNEDPKTLTSMLHDVSTQGIAPKQDPALYAMALIYAFGNDQIKNNAGGIFNDVIRIGTHVFQFYSMLRKLGKGNGHSVRKAIGRWYSQFKDNPENLLMQVLKYGQRSGMDHKDMLNLSHACPDNSEVQGIFKWIICNTDEAMIGESKKLMEAYQTVQNPNTPETEMLDIVVDNKLPWELIPTYRRGKEMWQRIIPHMGMTALIRNLSNMTKLDAISEKKEGIPYLDKVVDMIRDEIRLKHARIHPITLLTAMKQYERIERPIKAVLEALEEGFYKSFKYIEPTKKRFMFGVDVSGSMTMGEVCGCPNLRPVDASALLALQFSKVEEKTVILGFSRGLQDLGITRTDNMYSVIQKVHRADFGSTNPSALISTALHNQTYVDCFVIVTDNEANYGGHPSIVLDDYKKKVNPDAKMVVISMLPVNYSIADPSRTDMLDVVGFDSSVPGMIQDFAKS